MYFYTYKVIYIMWNIMHLSASFVVVPTIFFYQCTDNASGTLRQFPELQKYLSESENRKGGSNLNYSALPEGRE